MEICRIFVGMYGVRWEGRETDSLQETFQAWQDIEKLEAFFEANAMDLSSGFFGRMSVERAVRETAAEARRFEKAIVGIARLPRKASEDALEAMFRPLDDLEWRSRAFSRRKAKGSHPKSWLRLYAIRVDRGTFVVTGGAIKLTHKLQDRPHTREALRCLELCAAFLKAEQVMDGDTLYELTNEF